MAVLCVWFQFADLADSMFGDEDNAEYLRTVFNEIGNAADVGNKSEVH